MLTLKCNRDDIARYNVVANEITNAITSHYTNDPTAAPLTLNDLLGYSWGHITTADLDFIRAIGITNIDPALDSDEWVFEMAARLGPRTENGYREWEGNLQYSGICDIGFSERSFITETESSWNAQPGDALITINSGHPLAGLFKATGIVFTHSGIATGPNGVRHNTSYFDYIGNYVDQDPISLDPDWLAHSSPGTLTENLDGTFCKVDPAHAGTCSNNPDKHKRREFEANYTLLLTTSDPVHRERLKNVLNWALNTEKLYGVYGFTNGVYNNGQDVCSTFVRDAVLWEYSDSEFFNSVSNGLPDVHLDTLGFQFIDPVTGQNVPPSVLWSSDHAYNDTYKAFWYNENIRVNGANYLYNEIFNSIEGQVNENIQYNPIGNFFNEISSGTFAKEIRQRIGTQLVNCFAFGEPCDDLTAPQYETDPDNSLSFNGQKPVWDWFHFYSSPVEEEGWAFSADDLLYISSPYDSFEKLVRIESQLIKTEYCPDANDPATCLPMISQMCDQNTGIDMLTKLPCETEVDLKSCAADGPICECQQGQSCNCSVNNAVWVQMNTSISATSKNFQIEFDNDRLDGNSSSIHGLHHGPYYYSYTVQTDQTLEFTPWHDHKDYPNLAPDQPLEDPPVMMPTTSDYDDNPVNRVSFPVIKGDVVTIEAYVDYGFHTMITWHFKKNGYYNTALIYTLPHTHLNPVTSLYRSFAMRFSPWEFQ